VEIQTMLTPMQITFRHMDSSAELEARIQEKAAKLEEFGGELMGCRVVVEPMGKHHHQGNLYDVRIDLTVPGEEIAVTQEASQHPEYKDVLIAIRDAFDSARRQLEDYVRRRRGSVKQLDTAPHARVTKLFPIEGYGFLQTLDGREIYFHKNSVLNQAYADLKIGAEVVFIEEQGEKGPQASTVKPAGRHHHQ
jgi:cold shock CspA family protein/ribosome-associated translation inhibitor RaiA